jgi:hypothetical protein
MVVLESVNVAIRTGVNGWRTSVVRGMFSVLSRHTSDKAERGEAHVGYLELGRLSIGPYPPVMAGGYKTFVSCIIKNRLASSLNSKAQG